MIGVDAEVSSVLNKACDLIGLNPSNATLIRISENVLYRLPGGLVVRIARTRNSKVALKEVRVARWLEARNIDAIRVRADIDQPVMIDGRAATFWHELPPHKHGAPVQVGHALRRLHDVSPPTEFELPILAPFVRLAERIDAATTLGGDNREWLSARLAELSTAYLELPSGLPVCVVHGDAWGGNIVSTSDNRVVLLDFERCSIGRPEWDLASVAVKYDSVGQLSRDDYQAFVHAYGHDVMSWDGYSTLRDIRELRLALFAAQIASQSPAAQNQALHRVACLRGERGARPWRGWRAMT